MTDTEGNMMAGIDVSDRLAVMESQLNNHSSTLDKMGEVLVVQAETNAKILNLHERMQQTEDRNERRFDKLEIGIEKNNAVILKWSGSLAVLIAVVGAAVTFGSKMIS